MAQPEPPRPLPTIPLRTHWTQPIAVVPRGLSLARETADLLAWDGSGSLVLFNRQGQTKAQTRFKGLTAAAAADDASAFAAAGNGGEVWWLTPALKKAWERQVPARVTAAAVESLGRYLAVADANGGIHLFHRSGRPVWQTTAARPLHQLAFVPTVPFLLGCADYGLVTCIDAAGESVWREALVAQIGGMTVAGDGTVVLACYSEGLRRFHVTEKERGRLPFAERSSLVALDYAGNTLLAVTLAGSLYRLDGEGREQAIHPLQGPLAAVCLSPTGGEVFLGFSSGSVMACSLPPN